MVERKSYNAITISVAAPASTLGRGPAVLAKVG